MWVQLWPAGRSSVQAKSSTPQVKLQKARPNAYKCGYKLDKFTKSNVWLYALWQHRAAMDWKLTKTPCSPWALTEAQLGISISISGRQLPGCQCLHHIFLASTEIQAMTILHSPVEKNVGFRSNFMSVGREHEHKRMQMSIIQKFWVGERRNHRAVWELHPSVCEVLFVYPVKCVWLVFLRLEVEVRKLFLYQYRLFTSYMQSHFINDRKGKKWKKKKKRLSSALFGFHCFIHLPAIILPREKSFSSPGMSS